MISSSMRHSIVGDIVFGCENEWAYWIQRDPDDLASKAYYGGSDE